LRPIRINEFKMEKLEEGRVPLVTVFTTLYNSGKFVVEALKSVQSNHYPNTEHIIIDDFSKDDSVKIVQNWIEQNNYKCIFIKHEKNVGLCKTLNEVLSLAKGKYIFGISDDLLTPEFITTSVNVLEAAGDDYCLSFCDSNVIDEESNDLGVGHYSSHNISFDALPKDEKVFEAIINGNFINAVGAMYRTQYLREVGGYDESLYFEDWDVNIRLLKKYKIKGIDKKLTKYRIRANSMSTIKSAKYYESLLLICFRIYKLETSDKNVLRKKIADFAEYYFKAAGDSNRLYIRAFFQTMNIKILVFIFLKWLGLSYVTFEKFLPKRIESGNA